MLQKTYDSLLTLFYPQDCEICKRSVEKSANGLVCEDCWLDTRIFSERENLCFKCGRILNENQSDAKTNCQQCVDHFYENARAIGFYEGALASSILNLKRTPYVSKRIKNLFMEASQNPLFQNVSLIIPIPLSKNRMLERGFNQSQILAEIISRDSGIPIDSVSLIRTKHAKVRRAGMDKKAREMSVEKSFEVKREKRIAGKSIVLIDDVFASGATVSSCAKVLKKKGAGDVYVLTVARAN